MVADVLSRKTFGKLATLFTYQQQIVEELDQFGMELRVKESANLLAQISVQPSMVSRIKAAQFEDPKLVRIAEGVRRDSQSDFRLGDDGVLWFSARLYILVVPSLREEVLSERIVLLFMCIRGVRRCIEIFVIAFGGAT